jgi:two-component system, NarL family, sensor histidine kinase UhpB
VTVAPSRRPVSVRTGEPELPLRAVLDAALDAVVLIDDDGAIRLWNRQAEALLGWTAAEAVGRTFSSLIDSEPLPGRQRQRHGTARRATGKRRQIARRREVIARHRDGHAVPVELGITPIHDGRNRFLGAWLRDVSERRRREAMERLQSCILENVHDSVIVVDLKGRVQYWNQGAEALYGYRAAEIVGRSIGAVLPEGEAMEPDLERILAAGDASEEAARRHKDGTPLWVETRRSVMRDAAGDVVGVLGVAKDVTQRHRVAAELERSRAQLRNLADRLRKAREDERTSIARQIHDEMGQVLTALRLDVAWLEARIPREQPSLLDKCATMARLIEATIGQIRTLATQLRPAVLDDLGLAAAIEWETQEFARRTGILCTPHLRAELSGLDPHRAIDLFRILQEALTNVARHARATHVEVRVGVTRKGKERELVLHVEDDGRGIRPEETADARALGLLGMRERALLWNGGVEVRPRAEGGTRVTVKFPLPATGLSA